MSRLSVIFSFLFFSTFAQDLVNSGPMVGYSTMQEVLLWVQTTEKAKVHFEYYEISNSKVKFKTKQIETTMKNGFVAKLIADLIKPGKKYNYDLWQKADS